MEKSKLRRLLSNKVWRINNLYKIKDKQGRIVTFTQNSAQAYIRQNRHFRNVILKARQLGFTTDTAIDYLDYCLFVPNVRAGMIAEDVDKAKEIFEEKIRFAYDRLPGEIKDTVRANTKRAGTLKFTNGSSISVATSFRSGTLQLLHVSELGKICSKYPEKAKEIKTGSLESVPKDGIVTYESTAEGQYGYFYEVFQEAMKLKTAGKKLSPLQFKPFFFAWFLDPDYKEEAEYYNGELDDYFEELRIKHLINLTPEQKAWYWLKYCSQKDDMWQEYPSTPDEAFKSSVLGAYYNKEMLTLRGLGLIDTDCYDPDLPVYTSWDIGTSDSTAVWFFQVNKFDSKVPVRFIDYYENSGEGFVHYARILKQKGYSELNPTGYKYHKHFAPHDFNNKEYFTGVTTYQKALKFGIPFELVQRVSFASGIDCARECLVNTEKGTYAVFDKKCREGVLKLERYKKKFDNKHQIYLDEHEHDDACHCADSFRYASIKVPSLFSITSGVIYTGI